MSIQSTNADHRRPKDHDLLNTRNDHQKIGGSGLSYKRTKGGYSHNPPGTLGIGVLLGGMVMGEPARQAEVVDLGEYLDKTIIELDNTIRELQATRTAFAIKRAVLRAATSGSIQQGAADYETRVGEQRPYEDAQDPAQLIAEAHRRFVT